MSRSRIGIASVTGMTDATDSPAAVREEPATTPRRQPRRDALRNDKRVLGAARAVFAELGPGASIEEIARRAGVGVATIYRRFAGKEALLDAIAEQLVRELDDAADQALADQDRGHGLKGFLEYVARFNAEKSKYTAALLGRTGGDEVSAATNRKVDELTRLAIEAGDLAPRITSDDIRTLIVALRAVAETGEEQVWRRFLRHHLAGLRADTE